MAKTRNRPPLSWWCERLGIYDNPESKELFAVCPAHNDNGPSLHITKKDGDDCVVHCFAGCTYAEILAAVEDAPPKQVSKQKPNDQDKKATKAGTDLGALEWWVQYTGIPEETWDDLGAGESGDYVCFGFGDGAPVKGRLKGTKTFKWSPAGAKVPPLWPPPKATELTPNVFFTEGESDCGVLRHLGYHAFGLTAGSLSIKKIPRAYVKGFKESGVERIYCCFDFDEAGDKGLEEMQKVFKGSGISIERLNLGDHVAPFTTEKDLKDLWLRLGDNLKPLIEEALGAKEEDDYSGFAMPSALADIEATEWLWEGMMPKGSVLLFCGDPKVGKSTFLFPLFNRMHNGGTIGGRPVTKGGVVYLSEEALATLKPKHDVHGPLPNVYVKSIQDLQSMKWEEICSLAGRMARATKASVICVDTFAAFAGFDSGEENDAAAVSERLAHLIQYRGEFTVILVHHTSKAGGTRGSSAIDASVDGILKMTRGQGMTRLISSVNRVEANEQAICIDPKTGTETLVVAKVKIKNTSSDKGLLDQILDFLIANPNASERAVAAAVGIDRAAVHLQRLVKRDLVEKITRTDGDGRKRSHYRIKQGDDSNS